jgi:signal transduction histidine kinase
VTLAKLQSGSNGNSGFVAVVRDITQERKVDQMKSDFVANVAHEIRSPMAPMKDAVALVMDGSAGPVNEKQKRFLEIVDSNLTRLTRLINELLDLSRIEAGRMSLNMEKVDLSELVSGCVLGVEHHAGLKGLSVAFKDGAKGQIVECDKDRMTQVLLNLINNAVKFTPAGGQISVETRLQKGLADSIAVIVKDTGRGIAKSDMAGLFDRFKQLSTGDGMRGSGLGLSISKAIVEMHGGKIWVESEGKSGSSFIFSLPLKR